MQTFVSAFLVTLAAVLAVPVSAFFLEIVAALALPQPKRFSRTYAYFRPGVAVLVPAHNESAGLLLTIADIKKQLTPGDRLIVVADNCTDDTAAIARAIGADVIERHDRRRIGKGYALDYGLGYLANDPRDIVIMIDADCRLSDGVIDDLARTCALTRRPVQALYLMQAPQGARINQQIAEFAWRIKNWLRPLGLRALNLPCQLTGTGMAFPWEAIRTADLAHGGIVEDMKLGIDLARVGSPPMFCPSARVTSKFPTSRRGAGVQRQRWEHGHIQLIMRAAVPLLVRGFTRANVNLVALALDLMIPPLSLLAFLIVGMDAITTLAAALGYSSTPLLVSAATSVTFAVGVLLGWLKCGRDVFPPRALFSIAAYMGAKFPLYVRALSGRFGGQWIRTDRK